MLQKKDPSILNLALMVALSTTSLPMGVMIAPVLAQTTSPSATFALPTTVPKGTTVRIDGSSNMAAVSQTLKQRFETRFPGTAVRVGNAGAPTALRALVKGELDLVGIGRPLTADEQAQGLVAVPVGREKIAIVVGSDNPFNKSLTIQQYARIFRGEITDWAEVGGTPGAIRVIDRPEGSDTRQSFRNYPVFKNAEFKTGATAQLVLDDSTGTVISKLGADGIGYAIANQSREAPGIRPLLMHNRLPDNPQYPFSQPLAYVYKGTPNQAVAAFLGYATAPDGQQSIQSARGDLRAVAAGRLSAGSLNAADSPTVSLNTTVSASPVVSRPPAASISSMASPVIAQVPPVEPTREAASPNEGGIPPWLLWLLPLGLLGLLLWWLFGKKDSEDAIVPPASEATPPASPAETGRSEEMLDPASRAGSVINSDRAAIAGVQSTLHPMEGEVSPEILSGDTLAAGPPTGALEDGNSLPEAAPAILETGIEETAVTADSGVASLTEPSESTLASPIEASTSPEILPLVDTSVVSSSTPQGVVAGAALVAGAARVTRSGQAPSSVPVPALETSNLETANLVEQPLVTLDVIAELSELEAIVDADSDSTLDETSTVLDLDAVVIPSSDLQEGTGTGAWPLPTDTAQSKVEAIKFDVGQTDLTRETLATVDEGLPDLPDGYGESRIVLLPRDPHWAYAYWDVPIEHKMQLRQQGGQSLVLRLCDVTDINISHQSPHSLQQFDCDELAREWYLAIPVSDRDYLAEIGYVTADGRWLMLARSRPVRIPPIYPSDWSEDRFASINWEEDLRGKTFLELVPPGTRSAAAVDNPIYERIFGMAQGVEAQRIAGSLFGSMQQVPQQAISSFIFPSGMGSTLPTPGVGLPTLSGIGMSGIGMSGIGMSGIGMSGVGFGASMPPTRPRKFWLVADAELIVYGATEPDAKVTIAGQPVKLNPDGTFRFQMSFQNGEIDYPILAVAADDEQTRSIHMNFTRETPHRNTNTKDEATDEWF